MRTSESREGGFRFRTLIRLTALAASLTLLLVSSRAQSTSAFEEKLDTDVDAIAQRVDFDMSGWGKVHGSKGGRGQIPYLQALGHPPKRVALVSFYAYDPGNTKG